MFGYLFNSIIIGILLGDVVLRIFPDFVEKISINFSFKCIYLYSKVQLFIIKIKNKSNYFINNDNLLISWSF